MSKTKTVIEDIGKLLTMLKGRRYEDEYGNYLKIFQRLENLVGEGNTVLCVDVPASWVALVRYIGATVSSSTKYFKEDEGIIISYTKHLTRHFVSVMCCHRPETVDFLWKLDYKGFVSPTVPNNKEPFPVTCNGSFYRKEVVDYLAGFRSDLYNGEFNDYRNIILVPCAADKPYPSPMHKEVIALSKEVEATTGVKWKLVTVTGVLGVVPDTLWHSMPNYDSGIPNDWRCMNKVREFLSVVKPSRVVSYCDYYNEAIYEATLPIDTTVTFVNDVMFYSEYLDLLDSERLRKLETTLVLESARSVK